MNVLRYGRLRVLGYVAALLGLAAISSTGRGLFAFFVSPFGLGLGALLLYLWGASLEEAGRVVRIRVGSAGRVGAAVLLAIAAFWAFDLAPPIASAPHLMLVAGALASLAFAAHDARVAYDARAGQRLRLRRVSPRGIDISLGGTDVHIPLEAVEGVSLVRGERGRGALLRIDPSAGERGSPLPVSHAPSGELLLELTEHEAGVDAELLASRIRSLSVRGPGGYR